MLLIVILGRVFSFLDTHVSLVLYLCFFVVFGVVGYWWESLFYFLTACDEVLLVLLADLLDAFLHGLFLLWVISEYMDVMKTVY